MQQDKNQMYNKAYYFDCKFEDLTYDLKEVYQLMGYGEYEPSEFVQSTINEILVDLKRVMTPRYGYVLVDGSVIDSEHIVVGGIEFAPGKIITHAMKNADYYALFTVTIGKGFDDYCRKYKEDDDMLRAFITDALGSILAEAVVARLVDHLKNESESNGLHISNNYSPGYCNWKLVEQRKLFHFFPKEQSGISLTDSCLMLPVKSVSGIIAIGKNVKKHPYGCAICNMKSCIMNKKKRTT